jgi:hypothetical protein
LQHLTSLLAAFCHLSLTELIELLLVGRPLLMMFLVKRALLFKAGLKAMRQTVKQPALSSWIEKPRGTNGRVFHDWGTGCRVEWNPNQFTF